MISKTKNPNRHESCAETSENKEFIHDDMLVQRSYRNLSKRSSRYTIEHKPESEVSDQSVSSFWTQYQQSPSTWFTFSPKTGNEETASLKSTLCPFSCSTCKSDSHLLEGGICFSFNGVRQAGSPVLC